MAVPRLPAAALALAACSAMLLATPAMGQGQACAMDDEPSVLPGPTQTHAPGEALPYDITFSAPAGSLGGEVALTLATVTEGWNATLGETSFTLSPTPTQDAQHVTHVEVVAPGPSGQRNAQVSIQAQLTCSAPGPVPVTVGSTGVTAMLQPALQAPPADGAGSPASGGDDAVAWLAGLLLLLLLLGAIAFLATRRRPLGLQLTTPQVRREVASGGGVSFTVEAANRGTQPVEATLEVGEPEATGMEGWRVIPPPRDLALEPGAARALQVLVRSPLGAQPGDRARVRVELRSPTLAKPARLDLEAVVEGSIGIGVPGPRPRVVVRDEAALGGKG